MARRSGLVGILPGDGSKVDDVGSNKDGSSAVGSTTRVVMSNLRKGKWTSEEESYANKIILLFNQGLLSVIPGTTLRSFLSEKLNW